MFSSLAFVPKDIALAISLSLVGLMVFGCVCHRIKTRKNRRIDNPSPPDLSSPVHPVAPSVSQASPHPASSSLSQETIALDVHTSQIAVKPPSFDKTFAEEELRLRQQQFIQATQKCLAEKMMPSPPAIPLSSEAARHAEEAFSTLKGRQSGGYCHMCVTTEQTPGWIFKKPRGHGCGNESYSADYVAVTVRAKAICKEHNLYLLHIPESVPVTSLIIGQQLLNLLEGDERAYYRWAIQDPALQPFIKEALRQLTILICLLDFSDVKFDNISWTKEGRIALFDLDTQGFKLGLLAGAGKKGRGGIFNLIPPEWFDEFSDLAKKHLTSEKYSEVQERLPKLKIRAQERQKRLASLAEFRRVQGITSPSQPLIFSKEHFLNQSPKVITSAQKFIEEINKNLAKSKDISLIAGRRVVIAYQDIGIKMYDPLIEQTLTALIDARYLHSFKISPHYAYSYVFC